MKRKISTLSLMALFCSFEVAKAEYIVVFNLNDQKNYVSFVDWITTDPILSNWINVDTIHSCNNWSPLIADVTINQSFTQIATDCLQNQTRSRQERLLEQLTGKIKNSGDLITESQSIEVNQERTAIGTKETWITYVSQYGNWTDSGGIYGCSAWTPDASTVASGSPFTQNRSCSINQTRTRQDRLIETTTNEIKNNGAVVNEPQTIPRAGSQAATGTKIMSQTIYSPPNYMVRCTRTWGPTNSCILSWGGINNIGDFGVFNPAGQYYDVGGYRYTAGSRMSTWSDEDMDEDLYQIIQTKL